MSLGDSLQGSAFFLPTVALALIGAWLLVLRRFGHLGGLARWLAISILATYALILAGVIPAALGILSRPTMLLCAAALALLAWRVSPGPSFNVSPGPSVARTGREIPPSSRASVAVAAIAVLVTVIYELARLRNSIPHLPYLVDAVAFHLPGVTTWIQSGTLWRVDQFLPGFATAQYPNNGDFLLLASIIPWHDLALARLAMVPFFALTGVGAYALALEIGSSRAAGATFSAAALTVPYISQYAFDAIPDLVSLSMLALGLVFLVRHLRSGVRADLLLGGLALGICFGAKWYGVTTCAVVALVWLGGWWLRSRDWRRTAKLIGQMLAMVAAGGGIWLVRNLIESGNPIYPKAVKLLGFTVFPGSHRDVIDRFGFSIAHYLGQPHILSKYIFPGFRNALGLSGLALLGGVLITAAYALRPGRRATTRSWRAPAAMLVATTLGICVLYAITPGSAYGPPGLPAGGYPTLRWLMPAVVVGAPVAAFAVSRLGVAGLPLELAGLAGVIDGIHLGDGVQLKLVLELVVLLGVAAGAFLIVRRRAWALLPRSIRHRTATVVGVALLAASGIFVVQRSFHRDGYAAYDPVFAYIIHHAPSGHRVGIAGEATPTGLAPVLPMAGPRLGNRVAYVGDVSVHSVELPASPSSFAAELRRGHFDLLEIGLEHTASTGRVARRLGYRLLVSSPRLALYRLSSDENR